MKTYENKMQDRLVNRIGESDVRDAKLRGRPRTGWMDSVKRMLNERNICGARKDDCA